MGKWKLIIMILFILNDYLKPPKAQHNLSIRHSGPHNSIESKHPSVNMVNRRGEKQRRGVEGNVPEPPEVERREGAGDLRNRQPWSGDRSFHTRMANIFTWRKINSFQWAGWCGDRLAAQGQLVALPWCPWGTCQIMMLFPIVGGRRFLTWF